MNRLIRGLVALGLAVGIVFAITSTTAQASRHYVTTPNSLRGTWYQYDQDTEGFTKLVISKYKIYYKMHGSRGDTINGKRFVSGTNINMMMKPRHFGNHGYWWLGESQSDFYFYLKRSTTSYEYHKYATLRDYDPYTHGISIWTHHKLF